MKEHQDDKESDASRGRKFMKLADSEEDDQEIEENNTSKTEIDGEEKSHERVCQICNKKFSSGKALGGHMSSAHVQAKGQKTKSYSKKSMKRKHKSNYAKPIVGYDDFVDEFDEDGDYYSERLIGKKEFKKKNIGFSCRFCGKDFPSEKSLFGHMRCHPNRPYRGMDPPDSNNPDSSMPLLAKSELEELQREEEAVSHEENVVDLAQALVGTGWFAKGRQGSGPTANSSSATEKSDSVGNDQTCGDEVDDIQEHRFACYLLMHLHNNVPSKSNLADENLAAEAEDEAMRNATPLEGMEVLLDFAMSKKIASEGTSNEEAEAAGVMNQLKNKAILENGKDDNSSNDTELYDEFVRKSDNDREGKGNIVEQKKRRKYNNAKKVIIVRKEKLASSSTGAKDHVNATPSVATAPPPPPPPPPTSPPQYAGENGKEFKCSYCGKIFSTHQALGGHTSSHNKFKMSVHNTIDENGGIQKMMICGQSPSSKGKRTCKKRNKAVAAASAAVQKVLDFDLNELPEGEY